MYTFLMKLQTSKCSNIFFIGPLATTWVLRTFSAFRRIQRTLNHGRTTIIFRLNPKSVGGWGRAESLLGTPGHNFAIQVKKIFKSINVSFVL